MNLNKAELIGNLVADPIVKALPSGQSIATFNMATNYTWRDSKTKEKKNNTEYHPIIAWGKLGDVVGKYLKKGDKAYIDGRLRTRTWEGKDGIKHNRTEIIAQNMIMLGGARSKPEKETEKVNDEVVVEEVSLEKVPVEDK